MLLLQTETEIKRQSCYLALRSTCQNRGSVGHNNDFDVMMTSKQRQQLRQ